MIVAGSHCILLLDLYASRVHMTCIYLPNFIQVELPQRSYDIIPYYRKIFPLT